MRRVLVLMMVVGMAISMMAATGCRKKTVVDDSGISSKNNNDNKIQRPPVGKEMVPESSMPKVYFDFDKYDIRADQQARVDKSVEYLKANATVKVRIEGNCDERGTNEYNLSLGENRAKTIADFLAGHGVAKERVSILSLGEENPADMGKTDEAYAKNRRDEFYYTAK
jgi:peptidoglycan-associated lipoprotein